MSLRLAAVVALVGAAFLAGCSDSPPSGALTAAGNNVALADPSGADVVVVAKVDPINDQGLPVPVPADVSCAPGGVPNAPGQVQCVDPSTTLNVTFTFPAAETAQGYNLYVVTSAGAAEQLGAMTAAAASADANAPVTYTFAQAYDQDLSEAYSELQVRHGPDVVVATAPWARGMQTFALNTTLTALQVTGEYEGSTLTLQVSGLPEDGTWNGVLYQDDGTGVLKPVQSFPLQNGENILEADDDVDAYQEFHIHLGTSKVNVYKATIG